MSWERRITAQTAQLWQEKALAAISEAAAKASDDIDGALAALRAAQLYMAVMLDELSRIDDGLRNDQVREFCDQAIAEAPGNSADIERWRYAMRQEAERMVNETEGGF